ncbi:hypothetical protein JKP88DRAFT_276514 [Tribonema minus]|uniref:Uncharacterized protein n=1 Tax=Tribonema minus TaxID=303371 RepID=A0A836CHI9_9STRA|nr:hypothetical protein JKP88DRAFT_276514 [Tribonema minus]
MKRLSEQDPDFVQLLQEQHEVAKTDGGQLLMCKAAVGDQAKEIKALREELWQHRARQNPDWEAAFTHPDYIHMHAYVGWTMEVGEAHITCETIAWLSCTSRAGSVFVTPVPGTRETQASGMLTMGDARAISKACFVVTCKHPRNAAACESMLQHLGGALPPLHEVKAGQRQLDPIEYHQLLRTDDISTVAWRLRQPVPEEAESEQKSEEDSEQGQAAEEPSKKKQALTLGTWGIRGTTYV